MGFIYRKHITQIYVPVELDGQTGKTIFEVAHRSGDAMIYWHLDDDYPGATVGSHQVALSPGPGKHVVTVIDQQGERMELYFEALHKTMK